MSKRIALNDFVEVDHTDLSDLCDSVQFASDHAQEDVSGFNASGRDEYLAGRTTQSFTAEFFGSYGSGEVHQTLYELHRDKTVFLLRWRPNQNAGVSATNPELRGNVQLLSYGPGAQRGNVDKVSCTFTCADSTGLVFYET